jgi:hypothetical protein
MAYPEKGKSCSLKFRGISEVGMQIEMTITAQKPRKTTVDVKSTKSIVQEVRPTLRSPTRPVSTFIVGEVTEAIYGRKHYLRGRILVDSLIVANSGAL